MCEMLIRTTDSTFSLRGDVVVLAEDGHPWTPAEREADFWLLVFLPGVPASEYLQYREPPEPAGPILSLTAAQESNNGFRRWFVDQDALAAVLSPQPLISPVMLDTLREKLAFNSSIVDRGP